jgi:ergothioneine biosynthesis protein EgtB
VRGAAEAIVRLEVGGSRASALEAHAQARVQARTGKARVSAGKAVLGSPKGTGLFTWDNELPTHEVSVPSFLIDVLPVRNGDYLEFVRASGYATRALWSDDGWAWKERRGMRHPHGWSRDGSGFRVRTLLDEIPLAEAASLPVSVSFAEAEAYARWKGERLPTEAELHRAMYGSPEGSPRRYPWGDADPHPSHGNFGFQRLSPAPAGSFPLGASAWGVMDLVGNGWEWTRSPFEPFPGFEVTMPSYPGYSKDFFDGCHYVLLGASWATDKALIRRSFRNWFQPHYPYVFSKFRCTAPA